MYTYIHMSTKVTMCIKWEGVILYGGKEIKRRAGKDRGGGIGRGKRQDGSVVGKCKATTRAFSVSGQGVCLEACWQAVHSHLNHSHLQSQHKSSLTQKFMIKVAVHPHTHKTQQITLTNRYLGLCQYKQVFGAL